MAKKFGKVLLATALIGTAAAGAYYFLKKKKEEEAFDFDSEDGDNEGTSRKYVPLHFEKAGEKVTVFVSKAGDVFEKTVDMLETYFKNGGVHFQLTYVSKEDLINAKVTPDKYKNLRVRVSGFSDYFVKLDEAIQNEVIDRTTQKCTKLTCAEF